MRVLLAAFIDIFTRHLRLDFDLFSVVLSGDLIGDKFTFHATIIFLSLFSFSLFSFSLFGFSLLSGCRRGNAGDRRGSRQSDCVCGSAHRNRG